MGKWKKRFKQLRESSMCRNVWARLQIEPDGQQMIVYEHLCDDDCAFLKAIHGDVHDVVVPDALGGMTADRDRWRNLANRLGTHLGEGLYSEGEWECREYAIAAYSTWQYTDGAQLFKYEVEPQPVWWFREGKEV